MGYLEWLDSGGSAEQQRRMFAAGDAPYTKPEPVKKQDSGKEEKPA